MNVPWSGTIVSVQPRIRLLRSLDERSHSYHGYVLRIDGTCAGEHGEACIAVGRAAHAKHRFRVGMEVSGVAVPVANPNTETAGWYRTSRLKVLREAEPGEAPAGPPFHGVPPDLETYRERGARRLDPRTYESRCATCMWGCRMPVGIILDQWNPSRRRYRVETFCYGPKSCRFYRAGRERTVPAKDGLSSTEGDWVDESATAHRGPDD
ncbi:MAG: hypothetical protein OXU42_18905 [Deltaproteobacteria bacterium]|nr:hypothetical protein [Deltaproteobacteria bacterium]